jgi:hypothetical protein
VRSRPSRNESAAARTEVEPSSADLLAQDSLAGWQIADKHYFDQHGAVAVRDGVLSLAAGGPGTGVRYTGPIPRVDYELAFEARRIEGHDFFCGLTFPVGESQCSLILGGWGGGSTGLSNVNGVHADENETNGFLDVQDGRWYRIRLRVTKERIAVWIDDKQTIDLATAGKQLTIWWEQEPMASLGIASWQTSAEFRKIRLTRLQ